MKQGIVVQGVYLVLIATTLVAFSALPAFSDDCQPARPNKEEASAMFAIPTAAAFANAKISDSDKVAIQSYIQSQLALHALRVEQFAALTPQQQRLVLAPGRQAMLSREERRAIMMKRQPVPEDVLAKIQANAKADPAVIERYAVALPLSLATSVRASKSYRYYLIGDKAALVAADGTIVDVVSDVI